MGASACAALRVRLTTPALDAEYGVMRKLPPR